MIEQALYEHLTRREELHPYLTRYNGAYAIFNQEAPADTDGGWGEGAQYGRIVFAEDLSGDPERTMGGMLSVDILCKEDEQFPEEIEPVLRKLIHGWFFSSGTFTVAAQWKNSAYFTEPTKQVTGCTVTFDLLGFPVMTTDAPDIVRRLNAWTAEIPGLHVINYSPLPSAAWRPNGGESAVYWRVSRDEPAGWIRETFQTIFRTATVKGHIFSQDPATAGNVGRDLLFRLYAAKRLRKDAEAPILVNRKNTQDVGADPLRTGQLTVEATYGVIAHREPEGTLEHINY